MLNTPLQMLIAILEHITSSAATRDWGIVRSMAFQNPPRVWFCGRSGWAGSRAITTGKLHDSSFEFWNSTPCYQSPATAALMNVASPSANGR